MLDDAKLSEWVVKFQKRWNTPPSDYSITSYDAALVILAAIETVAKSGAPVTRGAVRDAIQAGKVDTLQGQISTRQRRPEFARGQRVPGKAGYRPSGE